MSKASAANKELIEDLNSEYIAALDDFNMNNWLACFTQQGQYILTSEENVRRKLPIAFMLDDCYARLKDRVKQVLEIQHDSTEHYQMRHFTQLISATELKVGEFRANYNFSVYYTPRDTNQTETLCVGRYEDTIVVDNGEARFEKRVAIVDTNVLPRYVAYPV